MTTLTVGDTVRHRDNARLATITEYDGPETDTYSIRWHDTHQTRVNVHSSNLERPLYTATAADAMPTHVPRTQVPIEQCIELINAALEYRAAQQAMHDAHNNVTRPDIDTYERLADQFELAHDLLHSTIRDLPEQT